MNIKPKIHSAFLEVIENKIFLLQQTLADLKESGANETKSTAGDKHETALAMLQIEQANNRAQLQDALEQRSVLTNINPDNITSKVTSGSLLKTNRGHFYISVALGKLNIEGNVVTAISLQSPLGAILMGKVALDSVTVNGNIFFIESIE